MDWAQASVLGKGAFVGTARRSNDRMAFKLGNLADDRPNSTSRGRDKHHIARLKRGDLQKTAPRCQTRHTRDAQERLRREPPSIQLLHAAGRPGEQASFYRRGSARLGGSPEPLPSRTGAPSMQTRER